MAASLVAFPASAWAVSQPPPPASRALVARCLSRAPATLKGLNALRGACPGIGHAIDDLGLDAFLPPNWRQALTPLALARLDALAQRYNGSPLSSAPSAAALRAVAGGLRPPASPSSLWDRLTSWAGRWTAPWRRMLRRGLRSLGGETGSHGLLAVFFVLAGILLLTVLLVVMLELRSAGLIGSGRRPARRPGARIDTRTPPEAAPGDAPDWKEVGERPTRVLRLLVDALDRSHRIGRERHLTCREISAQARFDTERQRQDFAQVALLAERELYGPIAPTRVPEKTLRAAQALHARLLARPARPETEP